MKISKFCTVLMFSVIMTGCNYLDFDESTGMEKEDAYSYFENISRLVAGVYREVPSDWGEIGGALREAATDNAVYTWNNNAVWNIYTDAWSPINLVDDKWGDYYKVIYDANSFLENYSEENLKRFEWNTDYQENIKKVRAYVKEVEVLRAFYHFELAKRYGDIPLITRTYTLDEINSVKKTPFADVINFVNTEIERVAPDLVMSQGELFDEFGHITKGIALSIRSRALLYAASPLFAGEGDATEKWKAAARAAYDVINLGCYSLQKITEDPLYNKEGGDKVFESKQLIWEVRSEKETGDFEARNMPMGFEGAQGGNTPTQNLVDDFDFLTGETFNWEDQGHISRMYYGSDGKPTRDPRLYLNVICDGMTYMNQTVEPLEGGQNGSPIDGATMTGYYLKKLMNENVSFVPGHESKRKHHYPVFRYAEILLNYAEAMNEYMGPIAVDDYCKKTALDALNEVRRAAGMPEYTETDRDRFRQLVRKERRIELAFEDHRFWDIRRWKIGNVVERIYGVNKKNDKYCKELVQTRIWKNKMYLYPIPRKETFVNENLTQNPEW